MPLPDERPRQSVANLIGKFETQTKRLSLSASSPSRSSSVVSHITGDSTKEEGKERREWPPKSTTDSSPKQFAIVPSLYSRNPPPPLVTSSLSNPPTNNKQDATGAEVGEVEVPLTAKALNASQRQVQAEPNTFLENWRKDLPDPSMQGDAELPQVPDTLKPDVVHADSGAATPTLATSKKLGTPSTPRTPKTATRAPVLSKPTTSTSAARTPVKAVSKSPSARQSLASPAAQPLKPQHTGQSSASTAAIKRSATKPAPVSAKAPVRVDPASRVKTPTSSRPKTPSSGLFAPTAASLAKSRNAAPPVPTPVKKTHLSSNSIDRLSKPTAASQARMAAAAANTAKPAAAPRTVAAKSKAAPPPKLRKDAAVPRAPNAAVAVATVGAIGLATVAAETGVTDIDNFITSVETTIPSEGENIQHGSEGEAEAGVAATNGVEVDEEPTVEDQDVTIKSPKLDVSEEIESTSPEGEGEPTVQRSATDDLEDIVNLLESTSITKTHTETAPAPVIPDELAEIPDEEEK